MQEKKLRDGLKWLVNLHHGMSKGGDECSPPSDAEWLAAIQEAKLLLANTTEETEMGKLVKALTEPAYEVMDEHGDIWWTMPKEIFDEITTQFGEEEGDADRGD